MDIGARIRELRKTRGLTLEGLAARVGYSKDFIWKVEVGRENPSIKFLHRLSAALGVELNVEFVDPDTNGDRELDPFDDPDTVVMLNSWRELAPEERDMVNDILKALYARQRRPKEPST